MVVLQLQPPVVLVLPPVGLEEVVVLVRNRRWVVLLAQLRQPVA